jgi:hypothetical protein
MAMASGFFGLTLRDQFDPSQIGVNLTGAGHKQQLVTDTYTPNFDTHDQEADITNEVSGTGYTAGGKAFTSPTLNASSGLLTFDAADESWTGATISNIRGRVGWDDTPTSPVADPLTFSTNFGSDFSVTSGTFTIVENASGIVTIDYTP